MKGALAHSVNVAAVQTVFKAGIKNVVYTANQMGIDSRLPEDPSIALGTGSVSLYDMVKAYSVFANGGYRITPFFIDKITDSQGKVLYQHPSSKKGARILDKEVDEMMNIMLQAVVDEGTGTRLRSVYGLRNDLAGKTGTAQNYTDGWFIGYNPNIVAGVWVGASSPVVRFRTGTYGSGSAMALPVFGKFFSSISRDSDLKRFAWARFKDPSEEVLQKMACPDFKEDNLIDSFFNIFSDREGKKMRDPADRDTVEKEEKKGFFKRIFGKKK